MSGASGRGGAGSGCRTYAAELLRRQFMGSFAVSAGRVRVGAYTSHAEMQKSPPEGISVGLKDDNLFVWQVTIVGPAGTY